MREVILNAQPRKLDDQHGIKVARKNGLIPGIFYRKEFESYRKRTHRAFS